MSAAAALTPRVRIMVVCDDVRKSRTERDVFHLKGVRQSITADVLPFAPPQLWLFVLLSSSRAGDFPGYIRVVNDRTDRVIFHGHLTPRPAFGPNRQLKALRLPIRCRFPEEGTYTVQVWFFQESGSDVLKGELPFSVKVGDRWS